MQVEGVRATIDKGDRLVSLELMSTDLGLGIKAIPVGIVVERALFRTQGQVIGLKAEGIGRIAALNMLPISLSRVLRNSNQALADRHIAGYDRAGAIHSIDFIAYFEALGNCSAIIEARAS